MSSRYFIIKFELNTSFSRNSGIFYSVGASIQSSGLGVKSDPIDVLHESLVSGGHDGVVGDDDGVGGVPNGDMSADLGGRESGSVLSFLRNSVRRLGLKFGYIKRAEPHPDVLHDFQDEDVDLYHEYHCMTADEKPILINNVPVTVHRPEDCQQFFAQSQTEGYASIMEPPVEFVLAAKTLYKSNDDL